MWSEPNSVECSFVNVMEPGEEYLIFLSGKKLNLSGTNIPLYEVYSGPALASVFLYGEREYTTVELDENASHTYVPYIEAKGNEMFSETEAGYEAWLELKEKLFEKYGAGKDVP